MKILVIFALCMPLLGPQGALAAAVEGDVFTAEERADLENWQRFPGWKRIQVVKNGQAQTGEQARALDESVVTKTSDMQQLDIRNLDINTKGILLDEGEIALVFGADARFVEKGVADEVLFQGTLNLRGLIRIKYEGAINPEDLNATIEVQAFNNSWWMEDLGRFAGTIDEYDGEFAQALLTTHLVPYLSKPENMAELILLAQRHGLYMGGDRQN